ncbi:MAG: 5-oxoprolinase subunit PxpB [Tissierellia bacterium]|nr:5-oxoprolinase subunit PxpB [Tissierellia bacterium]
MTINYKPVGDQGLLMEFDNKISPAISRTIRHIMNQLEEDQAYRSWGIRELIPTYRSILILFDPMVTDLEALRSQLEGLSLSLEGGASEKKRVIVIPTCYGGDMGPDLAHVAQVAGLSQEEVIRRHQAPDYLVYMLGFTPGFTYLGGLDPQIATPRLEKARLRIPAGSVGIAEAQTGIYPIDSPGGWQLIGRTPLQLMVPEEDPPVLIRAGDYIRFEAIDQETYQAIDQAIRAGSYQVKILEEVEG